MDPSKIDVPVLKDLTIENITENVHRINSQGEDARLKYLFERLVTHLHDFARETRLSTDEWMAGIHFLTDVGKICTSTRQEWILLSDIVGLSLLVDSINHPKPQNGTEPTVLGPFHAADAENISHGESISNDPDGEPCLVICNVKDTEGRPIEGVKIDIWETDSTGHYDVQYENREHPDGRAVIKSDGKGDFWFLAVVPVPYPIPDDGPVGKLLRKLKRHAYRPAHVHFMFEKDGYDHLVTSLYLRGDPYETSDAVFGVKETLLVDLGTANVETARKYNVKEGTKVINYDFVLVSEVEAKTLREEEARKAMEALGWRMKLLEGLPVPDLD